MHCILQTLPQVKVKTSSISWTWVEFNNCRPTYSLKYVSFQRGTDGNVGVPQLDESKILILFLLTWDRHNGSPKCVEIRPANKYSFKTARSSDTIGIIPRQTVKKVSAKCLFLINLRNLRASVNPLVTIHRTTEVTWGFIGPIRLVHILEHVPLMIVFSPLHSSIMIVVIHGPQRS